MGIERVNGVGPKRAKALARLEIETVLDLLTHYPRRYLDRTRQAQLADLAVGEEGTVLVRVERVDTRRTRNRRTMTNVDVSDASGRIRCVFFNQPWLERRLTPGLEMVLFGKVDEYRGRRQMANPVLDFAGDKTGRIVPLYPQSDAARVNSSDIGSWIDEVFRRSSERGIADPVPDDVTSRWELVERAVALTDIHRPETMVDVDRARDRLVFDELLRVQLALVRRKRHLEATVPGIDHAVDGDLVDRFHDHLPYALTGAQARAVAEINEDLARSRPMHRLLQGDVGSGKTVVAVSALLVGVQGGFQGALMAPTEVLAEQHHRGVTELLDGFVVGDDTNLFSERPLRVELLTNGVTGSERAAVLEGLANGTVDLVIGTHALIQEGVDFSSLGVVVIDEQHRFGVEQRAALRDRGVGPSEEGGERAPDVLVMTATPIPRTAAMTVYGDLDVSVLDELPPGRTPVTTEWIRTEEGALELGVPELWERVRSEVAAGRQAYVVCPLIEESDALDVRSAEETWEELRTGELADLEVGPAPRPGAGRREGADHGPVPVRGDRRPGGHDGHRGRGRRAQRHGDGHPRRRPFRHRPTAPAARSGRARGRAVVLLSGRCRGHRRRRGATGRARSARPTGSSSPRWTSTCGARGRSWGSVRRAATTCGWRRCGGTSSGWPEPVRSPSSWSTAIVVDECEALVAEVDHLLGTDDTEFLLKS